MTVKEMHIDVSVQIQRLAANRNRKLQPQEIDWFLNSTQTKMIESAVTPLQGTSRFEIDRGKREIIANLLSGRIERPASWVTDKYITILPPDVWFLLDDGSKVCQICKGEIKTTSYTILNITAVSFPFTQATTQRYSSVELIYNNSSLINLTNELSDRQITWTGLNSTEEHFYIRDFLMDQLISRGLQVYWERFNDVFLPYTFLFITDQPAVPVSLKLDGQEYTGTTQQRTLEIHAGPRASTLVPNTMISTDHSITTGVTPYFKSSYISPVSELGPGIITTHSDQSFIVSGTTVNYIRKPRSISLTLGTDCSLSNIGTVHQELCNRTAETILNRIMDPAWKEQTEQNLLQKTN